MEGGKFFNILRKQRYTLMAIPLLVMGIAFMLVRKLPDVYSAKGSLSAGILDGSQEGTTASMEKNILQESKVNQDFSNLLQMMQMKKVYDQVSYQLIIHDFTSPTPFRPPSKMLKDVYRHPDAKEHALQVYNDLYTRREPLSLWDKDQKGMNDVLISMGYDYESLTKKLHVYRVENSDFIDVEYESDSPKLSAFVVNTLCKEFIEYHSNVTKENERRTIHFLADMLASKKDSLDTQVSGLRDFKISNRVLNLNEQAKSLYGQMTDFETRIELLQKDIKANEGALDSINGKFRANNRGYVDSKLTSLNQDIILTKQQLKSLNEAYIKNNFDPSYTQRIDSLKEILSEEINQTTDKVIMNPLTSKENLVAQKMNLEVNQDLAKSSLKSLQDELGKLNKRFDTLVPHEAVIQAYEGNINVASQEYLELLKKYNQTTMAYNSSSSLKQIEMAMPGAPQPSKKMLLVIISGLGSFVFCLLVLFIIFFLDDSINTPQELANKTNMLVLGYLPMLNNISLLNLNQLWRPDQETDESRALKTQLRSIRFETDNELRGAHMLAVTSIGEGEGKTFLSMSLASAHLMINKKVLLIDGNFGNPAITQYMQPEHYLDDYLTGKSYMPTPNYENEITVMGNRGNDTSLFEVATENRVRAKMEELRSAYDIIIIESSSLETLNLSKEWLNVADKVIVVFEAGKTLTTNDESQVAYLRSLSNKFIGWAINKVVAPGQAQKKGFFKKKAGN